MHSNYNFITVLINLLTIVILNPAQADIARYINIVIQEIWSKKMDDKNLICFIDTIIYNLDFNTNTMGKIVKLFIPIKEYPLCCSFEICNILCRNWTE